MEDEKKQKPADRESSEEVVERGKAAIEAAKKTDPKPASEQKKEDEADAEKWRNEG